MALNLCRVKLRDQQRLDKVGYLEEYPQYPHGTFSDVVPRGGNAGGGGQPGWVLKCKGWETDPNAYIYFTIQGHAWEPITKALGKPEWATDPAYMTAEARQDKIFDIFATIEEWLKDKTKYEAVDIFRKHDIPCAPVLSMLRTLAERADRPRKQGIEADIRTALETLPGVRTKVGLGGSGEKYVLVLTGDDPQALTTAALAVEKDLRTIPGLGSVSSTASLVRSEIAVRPDFARAADLGVTSSAIAETLRIATVGDYDNALPKMNLPQRQIPIVVKLDGTGRHDLSLLERLAGAQRIIAEIFGVEAPIGQFLRHHFQDRVSVPTKAPRRA